MHRAQRLDMAPGRSWKTRGNRLPTAIPMRSPPYEARASPRPRPRATQDVTFRVDQVLRRHREPRSVYSSQSGRKARLSNPSLGGLKACPPGQRTRRKAPIGVIQHYYQVLVGQTGNPLMGGPVEMDQHAHYWAALALAPIAAAPGLLLHDPGLP